MFNPFFTTRPPDQGTGLGPSMSHDIIVKQHGSSIEVDTQPGEFSEVRIVLPRVGASLSGPKRVPPMPASGPSAELPMSRRKGRSRRKNGPDELSGWTAACDPNVWSGRALQVDFTELAVSGLASMYTASDWSVLYSGPSWISAHVRSD